MRIRWMTSAVLAAGLSTVVPSLARADRGADSRNPVNYDEREHDRDHDRDRERERDRDKDFEKHIEIRDLPRPVMDTVDHERNGREPESAMLIRHDGKEYYAVHLARHDKEDLTVRVAPDGSLLGVDREREGGKH